MLGNRRSIQTALLLASLVCARAVASASPAFRPIKSIDLAKPFGAGTPWRLTATQGPSVLPDQSASGDAEPGEIRLCVSNDGGKSCTPDLQAKFHSAKEGDVFAEEDHYLYDTRLVYPRGHAAPPLFLMRTASQHGGNGSQRATLQILAYDKRSDRFHLAYNRETGGNMNQEMRYVAKGTLKGMTITAEPTGSAPYRYWIEVSRLTERDLYRRVLRYRSVTSYGDGNPLATIDSEMPNIQQRLGLWHPGQPLPLPDRRCSKPRLTHMELWCR
jgi:hypothetical protein